jgi:hypothetical protein
LPLRQNTIIHAKNKLSALKSVNQFSRQNEPSQHIHGG